MTKIKAKTAGIAFILLGVIGVVDAGILTYDHQKASLGQADATVCEPGGGCAAVRSSPMSAVPLGRSRPALPIALLGMVCYLVVIGLGVMRLRRPDNEHAPRLLLAIGVLATAYSAVLLWYSVATLGKVCPYCVVLYMVGLGVLVVAAMSLSESLGRWVKRVWRSAVSKTGLAAALSFTAMSFAGYSVYAAPLQDMLQTAMGKLTAQARELPGQPEVSLDVTGRPFEGLQDAEVHIVKFADYECPHCGSMFTELHRLVDANRGALRVTMMNFPLSSTCNPRMPREFHKNACLLARAGECAHRQGKWGDIAGWLYGDGRSANKVALRTEAERLGMDGSAFSDCLEDPETDAQIKRDIEVGVGAGVRATPTFFVNGRKVEGGRPPEVLQIIIDGFLTKATQ